MGPLLISFSEVPRWVSSFNKNRFTNKRFSVKTSKQNAMYLGVKRNAGIDIMCVSLTTDLEFQVISPLHSFPAHIR